MATFTLNIKGKPVELISDIDEVSNDCMTLFTFNIKAGAGKTVSLYLDDGGEFGYDYCELDNNGSWERFNGNKTFTMNSSGIAQMRIRIGNNETWNAYGNVNSAYLTISEFTNNLVSQSQEKSFQRTNIGERCAIPEPPAEPGACESFKAEHYTAGSINNIGNLELGGNCSEVNNGIRTVTFSLEGDRYGSKLVFHENLAPLSPTGPGGGETVGLSCAQPSYSFGTTVNSVTFNGQTVTPGTGEQIKQVKEGYELDGKSYTVYAHWRNVGFSTASLVDVYLICEG